MPYARCATALNAVQPRRGSIATRQNTLQSDAIQGVCHTPLRRCNSLIDCTLEFIIALHTPGTPPPESRRKPPRRIAKSAICRGVWHTLCATPHEPYSNPGAAASRQGKKRCKCRSIQGVCHTPLRRRSLLVNGALHICGVCYYAMRRRNR